MTLWEKRAQGAALVEFRVSGFLFRSWGFGGSGLGVRVLSFGLRVSGINYKGRAAAWGSAPLVTYTESERVSTRPF